jgi:hypothetical protein
MLSSYDVVHAYRQAMVRDGGHPRAEALGVAGRLKKIEIGTRLG